MPQGKEDGMDLRETDVREHRRAPHPRYAPGTLDVCAGRPLAAVTAEIEAVCARAEDAPGTPVVLRLTAASPPGSAVGEQPGWPGPETGIRHVTRWERALRRLERVPAAVVVHAVGTCAGPALDLLLVADHRVAAPDLALTLPVHAGRMWPGTLLHRLADQIGTRRARGLLAGAPALDAAQALAFGLVDEIDPGADAAGRAASRLAAAQGAELAVRRRLLLDGPSTDIDDALGAHLAACDRELRLRGTAGATASGGTQP